MTIAGPYTSAEDFKKKLDEEYAAVCEDPNSARHLVNFAMTAYHLHEWAWEDVSSRLPSAATAKSRHAYFVQRWPDFKLTTDLANGSKHCVRHAGKTTVKTGERLGAFGLGFSSGFDIGSLQIDDGGQMVDFQVVAERIMAYWNAIFPPPT